jgi:Protein of unknown function (DUF2971)
MSENSGDLKILPPIVFKYYPPERTEFLHNRLVRFTQPSELNDIFEFSTGVNQFLGPKFQSNLHNRFVETLSNAHEVYALMSQRGLVPNLMDPAFALEQIKAAISQIDFGSPLVKSEIDTLIAGPVDDFNEVDFFRRHGEDYGVFSLSSDALNPVMWYHYSQQYSGYVVGFNTFHPWFWHENSNGKSNCVLHKVTYEDTVRAEFASLLDDPVIPFLRKRLDWSYEKEWRMVKDLSQADVSIGDNIKLFEVPSDAITGIYFGPHLAENSPIIKLAATFKVMQNPNIEIGSVRPKHPDGFLEMHPYDLDFPQRS